MNGFCNGHEGSSVGWVWGLSSTLDAVARVRVSLSKDSKGWGILAMKPRGDVFASHQARNPVGIAMAGRKDAIFHYRILPIRLLGVEGV